MGKKRQRTPEFSWDDAYANQPPYPPYPLYGPAMGWHGLRHGMPHPHPYYPHGWPPGIGAYPGGAYPGIPPEAMGVYGPAASGQPNPGAEAAPAGGPQSLLNWLGTGQKEQFLLGLVVGAGAAWLLSDENLRRKILKAGLDTYTNMVGGMEELKEQIADLQAELDAERHEAP